MANKLTIPVAIIIAGIVVAGAIIFTNGSTSPGKAQQKLFAIIRETPFLERNEERRLAVEWRKHGSLKAQERLVSSHQKLVVSIAGRYRGYDTSFMDLVSAGNVGLIEAVRRFDPDRGCRLSTYAKDWIKAEVTLYILKNWHRVFSFHSTAKRKRIFFNLRRWKEERNIHSLLEADQAKEAARDLGVPLADLLEAEVQLFGQALSLDNPIHDDSERGTYQDILVGDEDPEGRIIDSLTREEQRRTLSRAIEQASLTSRERRIFVARELRDEPPTLAVLADEFDVSRERIRQIQARTKEKVIVAGREIEREGRRKAAERREKYATICAG